MLRQAFLADLPNQDPVHSDNWMVDQHVAGWMYRDGEDVVFRYVAMSNSHVYADEKSGIWSRIYGWGTMFLMIFGPLWSWLLMLFDDDRYEPEIKAFRTVRMPLSNIERCKPGGLLERNGVELKLKQYPERELLPGQKEDRLALAFPDGHRKHADAFLKSLRDPASVTASA